ncbi:MAG: hypothetical protein R2710_15085 [Acidimicrobiales bacterium]
MTLSEIVGNSGQDRPTVCLAVVEQTEHRTVELWVGAGVLAALSVRNVRASRPGWSLDHLLGDEGDGAGAAPGQEERRMAAGVSASDEQGDVVGGRYRGGS